MTTNPAAGAIAVAGAGLPMRSARTFRSASRPTAGPVGHML
jgi:hypothetical protein